MMSREIKFRAWDTHKNQWVSEYAYTELMIDFNGDLYRCSTESADNPIREVLNYKLMQYTGLKDKNGKEIYEGDIIRRKDGEDWFPYPFAVKYMPTKACYGLENENQRHYADMMCDQLTALYEDKWEVIGNLYETPDLLTTPTSKEK